MRPLKGIPALTAFLAVAMVTSGFFGKKAIPVSVPLPGSSQSVQMMQIPGGTYRMGCSEKDTNCFENEKPSREVTVDSFSIDVYEVTNKLWDECRKDGHCASPNPAENVQSDKPDRPVVGVTWDNAAKFCKWRGGRLPSEAEWEYAARAGIATASVENVEKVAIFKETSLGLPHPVGQKQPNEWGLFDMLGNVDEWVLDYYVPNLQDLGPTKNPKKTDPKITSISGFTSISSGHTVRGGNFASVRSELRFSGRWEVATIKSDKDIGFRCVKD